jgi:hypothetical protein
MERQLAVEHAVHGQADAVATVLTDEPARALAAVQHTMLHERRSSVTLHMSSKGGTSLGQNVLVTVGPREQGASPRFPLAWTPVGHQRLLPRFDGTLEVVPEGKEARLRLSGHYRAPLGVVGSIGDSTFGRHLAQRSATAFLAELAEGLEAHLGRAAGDAAAAEADVSVADSPAEIWLG